MKDNKSNLFSSQRFQLFTHQIQKSLEKKNNTKICNCNSHQKLKEINEIQSKQQLHELLYKRNKELKELKKKMKVYEKELTQREHEIDTKQYELRFFKKKMGEQLQKSKQMEKQIEKVNDKVIQMIKKLEIVKRLKNPLQLMKENKDFNKIQCELLKQITDKQTSIDLKNFQFLENSIKKVSQVIQLAFKLKKSKSPQFKDKNKTSTPESNNILKLNHKEVNTN